MSSTTLKQSPPEQAQPPPEHAQPLHMTRMAHEHPWAAAALVAAAYLIAGKLAQLMAIPPGYATAVWPPAGIALAVVLFFGPRIGLGVMLGSMLVNLTTAATAEVPPPLQIVLPMTLAVGVGAWLQAVVGAHLLRRHGDGDFSLIEERTIALFLLIGGPLSCLVSPTIGVTSLWLAGATSTANFAFSWWTWWVGDTIGVVIFAPIALVALGHKNQMWSRRRLTVAAPLVVGFAFVTLLFVQVSGWENARIQQEFDRRAATLSHALRERFNENGEVAQAVVGLFHTATEVSRVDFHTFAGEILGRHREIQALSYVPVIEHAARAAFEARHRGEGFASFAITQEDEQGRLRPAAARSRYTPVAYLLPLTTNAEAVGFDLSSEVNRRQTLQMAGDRGELLATPPIRLVQQPDGKIGFLLVAPVYRRGAKPQTAMERQAALRGFVTVVFLAQVLVDSKLQTLDHRAMTMCLLDTTASTARLLFAGYGAHPRSCVDFATADGPSKGWVGQFEAAGRKLQVRFTPSSDFAAEQRSWQPWFVLAGGLVFVALLGAVLLSLTGRETRLTAALEASARSEAKFAASEQRARALVRALPDMLFRQSRDGTYLDYAAPIKDELYAPPEAFLGKKAADVLPPEVASSAQAAAIRAFETGQLQRIEYGLHLGGQDYDFEARIVPVSDHESVTLVRNITTAKQAERALLAALRAQEVLLREVHHRVKNNLHVISSLLNLQAMRLDDPTAKSALVDCQNRVLSIALVHAKLYQSADLSHINAKEYLETLIDSLRHATNHDSRRIAFELAVDDVKLSVDMGISCGLIAHELVTNALKHAFVGGRTGRVAVTLRRDVDSENSFIFSVVDDGVGMATGAGPPRPRSLGLDLVDAFAQQLGATMTVDTSAGTAFVFKFAIRNSGGPA